MRYCLSGLLLVVCFGIGWNLGRTKLPPPEVNMEIQELSIDLGDFNVDPDPDAEPWTDITPGLLGEPVRKS
ncbi:MAG: hypothetical protein GY888_04615 [Planctomycetaceae bacterium]|nr:hypothetical protein [Planctomycetaceae bacterium]